MIQERILCPIEKGRRFIAVSLAEAETLRRILHGRGSDALIKNQTTQIALRCVPAGGCVFDHSSKWYVVYLSLFSHSCLFLNPSEIWNNPHVRTGDHHRSCQQILFKAISRFVFVSLFCEKSNTLSLKAALRKTMNFKHQKFWSS